MLACGEGVAISLPPLNWSLNIRKEPELNGSRHVLQLTSNDAYANMHVKAIYKIPNRIDIDGAPGESRSWYICLFQYIGVNISHDPKNHWLINNARLRLFFLADFFKESIFFPLIILWSELAQRRYGFLCNMGVCNSQGAV